MRTIAPPVGVISTEPYSLSRRTLVISTYDRHADAELADVSRDPAGLLLGAELVVPGGRQGLVEYGFVVAAVVASAGRGLEGEGVGGRRFLRRTATGSMPISWANRSTMRSMAAAASGRPAPRYAPTVDVLVTTDRMRTLTSSIA